MMLIGKGRLFACVGAFIIIVTKWFALNLSFHLCLDISFLKDNEKAKTSTYITNHNFSLKLIKINIPL